MSLSYQINELSINISFSKTPVIAQFFEKTSFNGVEICLNGNGISFNEIKIFYYFVEISLNEVEISYSAIEIFLNESWISLNGVEIFHNGVEISNSTKKICVYFVYKLNNFVVIFFNFL